jgi:hypothetical protein
MSQKVTLSDNQKIIISMTDQLSDLSKAKIRLIFLGHVEDAEKVSKSYEKLSEKIDLLIAKVMSEWLIDKQALLTSLNETNKKIDDSIDHIRKNVKTAEKVVKLLKQADKVIEIATDILQKAS